MSILEGLSTGLLTALATMPWTTRALLGAAIGATVFVALPPLFRAGSEATESEKEAHASDISADRGSVAIGGNNNTVYVTQPAQTSPPEVSFQKYALFWVRTDKNNFQIGMIAKLFNLDNKAHLIKGITLSLKSNTLQAHGVPYLMHRESVVFEHAEIIEDNFIEPSAKGYYKKLLPLHIELTLANSEPISDTESRPPEIKLSSEWTLKFENGEVPAQPDFSVTYDRFITPEQWDGLLRPKSTIVFEELNFKPLRSNEAQR
jgi:hypothetical protein